MRDPQFPAYLQECRRKVIHLTYEQAKRATLHLRRKGEDVQVYACRFASHYHVGHRRRSEGAALWLSKRGGKGRK